MGERDSGLVYGISITMTMIVYSTANWVLQQILRDLTSRLCWSTVPLIPTVFSYGLSLPSFVLFGYCCCYLSMSSSLRSVNLARLSSNWPACAANSMSWQTPGLYVSHHPAKY